MNIAIIPASSASKRLPGKNTALINGRPMISYPIDAAVKSGMFDQVIVSSRDDDISAIAKEYGARVFPAPASLRMKQSTCAMVCNSVLEILDHQGVQPDHFCCLYATAIFVTPEDILEASKLLGQTDFVMGVSEFIYEPEHALIEKNGFLRPVSPKSLRHKAPWFPRKYSSNGTIYWCRTQPFQAVRDFYGPRLLGYQFEKDRVWDINTPEDLVIAEKLKGSSNNSA